MKGWWGSRKHHPYPGSCVDLLVLWKNLKQEDVRSMNKRGLNNLPSHRGVFYIFCFIHCFVNCLKYNIIAKNNKHRTARSHVFVNSLEHYFFFISDHVCTFFMHICGQILQTDLSFFFLVRWAETARQVGLRSLYIVLQCILPQVMMVRSSSQMAGFDEEGKLRIYWILTTDEALLLQ